MNYELNIYTLILLASCASGVVTGCLLKKLKNKISPYCGKKLATVGISAISGYVGGRVDTLYTNITDFLPDYMSDYLESYQFIPSILYISLALVCYNASNNQGSASAFSSAPPTSKPNVTWTATPYAPAHNPSAPAAVLKSMNLRNSADNGDNDLMTKFWESNSETHMGKPFMTGAPVGADAYIGCNYLKI